MQTEKIEKLKNVLEEAYSEASQKKDNDLMLRIRRAEAALEAPTNINIFSTEFARYSFNQKAGSMKNAAQKNAS